MNQRTLKGLRNDLGYTQKQMAKLLEIPMASYQRYENFKGIMPADKLVKVADMFNIVDVREIKIK